MTDVFAVERRSAVMRAVKSRDTEPEMRVRRAAYAAGLRYRLHRSDLPGTPDLVFASARLAMFVHGCFWHGHDCARGARKPTSNADYWAQKLLRNRSRDARVRNELEELGWRTAVVWECETRRPYLSDLICALVRPAEVDFGLETEPKPV